MKIIQHGTTKRKLWWLSLTWVCLKCGCTFQVDEQDDVSLRDDRRTGEYAEVRCPECSALVQVKPL